MNRKMYKILLCLSLIGMHTLIFQETALAATIHRKGGRVDSDKARKDKADRAALFLLQEEGPTSEAKAVADKHLETLEIAVKAADNQLQDAEDQAKKAKDALAKEKSTKKKKELKTIIEKPDLLRPPLSKAKFRLQAFKDKYAEYLEASENKGSRKKAQPAKKGTKAAPSKGSEESEESGK